MDIGLQINTCIATKRFLEPEVRHRDFLLNRLGETNQSRIYLETT